MKKVFIVRMPDDAVGFSAPGDISNVYLTREAAQKEVDIPAGYINGDKNKPVLSGKWIDEREVL